MADLDDVIVLGAGHNGLVCACYLAMKGLQVRVLERRDIVGGAAVTEEFHPGFRNSIASYTVGLLDEGIIRDLKLREHGLKIVARPMANFFPLNKHESLSIYVDDRANSKEIARFSARDAETLPIFRSMIREVGEVVLRQMHRTPPSGLRGVRSWVETVLASQDVRSLSMRRRRDLSDLFLVPIARLLEKWFENPHVRATLAFDAIVGNYSSLHSPGSAYGLLHHALGEISSEKGVWGHPIGGMGAITQAMFKQASDLGVSVETSAEITQISINDGKADGVVLSDGTVRKARALASNLAPKHLYSDLVGQQFLDDEFHFRIQHSQTESAVLRINVALSELPEFLCSPGRSNQDFLRAGIVIGPTLDYMESAYLDARSGNWSKHPIIELLIPSTVDDSLAPEGCHVASLFCQHFPYDRDWDQCRDEAADLVFSTLDQYAPNFSGSVLARQILTPLDLEREFRLPRGDIFHGAHTPSQLWINRPLYGFSAYKSPIRRLFHCGAGAHPGGGVTGLPGRNAAREILRDF